LVVATKVWRHANAQINGKLDLPESPGLKKGIQIAKDIPQYPYIINNDNPYQSGSTEILRKTKFPVIFEPVRNVQFSRSRGFFIDFNVPRTLQLLNSNSINSSPAIEQNSNLCQDLSPRTNKFETGFTIHNKEKTLWVENRNN